MLRGTNLNRARRMPVEEWARRTGAALPPMSRRIPGFERTGKTLRDLIEGLLPSDDGRSDLVRLATRLIIEEALEAEVRDALGHDYHEHGAAPSDEGKSMAAFTTPVDTLGGDRLFI